MSFGIRHFFSFFLDINNGFFSKSHDKWDKVVNHVDQQCFPQHTPMIPDCSETMGTQIDVSNRSWDYFNFYDIHSIFESFTPCLSIRSPQVIQLVFPGCHNYAVSTWCLDTMFSGRFTNSLIQAVDPPLLRQMHGSPGGEHRFRWWAGGRAWSLTVGWSSAG